MWHGWIGHQRRTEVSTQNLALTLESWVQGLVTKADVALMATIDEFEEHIAESRVSEDEINAYIARQVTRVPELEAIRIADEKGTILYGTGVQRSAGVSIVDRDYFAFARDNATGGLFIAQPIFGRVSRKWVVNVARRIDRPDGSFAGVAWCVFPLEYMSKVFSQLDVGSQGAVSLRDAALRNIVRYPEPGGVGSSVGHQSTMEPFMNLTRTGNTSGTFLGHASFDQTERVYSFRRVRDLPLYIIVGRATAEYRREWWNLVAAVGALALAFGAASILLSRQVMLNWRNQGLVEATLRESNRTLESRVSERTEALQRSKAGLDEAQRISGMGSWEHDVATDTATWSENLFRLFGVDPSVPSAELFKRFVDQVLHRDDRDRVVRELREAITQARHLDTEYRIVLRDGSQRVIQASAEVRCDAAGRPDRVVGTVQDITARRHAENAARQEHALTNTVISSIPGTFYMISMEGKYLRWNAYQRDEIVGKPDDQMPSVSALDTIHPDDRALIADRITNVLVHNTDETVEARVLLRGGPEFRWLLMTGRQIVVNGQPTLVGIGIDTTERKKIEADLIRARDGAEAANRAKMQFLGRMSHELRTPLNGMLGMTGLLLESDLTRSQREQLEVVKASEESLLAIVEDVLDFARIEAGRLAIESRPFRVHDILRHAEQVVGVRARQKGLPIHAEVAAGVPAVVAGDGGRLRQVALNLMANAVKFTQQGEVRVRVELLGEDADSVELRWSVVDTGIGIEADVIPQLFGAFTQGDGSIHARFGGTGLGLAISKELVEMMGGRIGVESTPGRGSTFWFTTRCGKVKTIAPAAPGPGASAPVARLEGVRVLAAEDNTVNRHVLRAILERLGYTVDIVDDGQQAVDAVLSRAYDIVLMDIEMPRMDGIEATRRIRSMPPPNAHLPIVALTAHVLAEDTRRCINAGMDDFVSKPIDPQALDAVIQKRVAGRVG